MIIPIIFLTIMMSFFIISLILLIAELNKIFDKLYEGKTIKTECEKCKSKKMITPSEYKKEVFSKVKTKKLSINGASIKRQTHLSKKFHCEKCNKKTWHNIVEYQNKAIENTKEYIKPIIIFFIANYVFANGAILLYSILQKLF